MKNHYNALELDKNCTSKEIKESYLKLSKKYHPDKNKTEDAKKKILEINEAYAVLKNTSSRYAYDEKLKNSNKQQRRPQDFHQNNEKYNRSHTYGDYVRYYQKVQNEEFFKPKRKFTLVVCCCMLMMFGAGLRIMYAWSEAVRRRHISDISSRRITEMTNDSKNPNMEKIKLLRKRIREREMKRKSES